jgi:hypothetical protein
MSIWDAAQIQFTEVTTLDIGNTTLVTANMEVTESSNVKLNFYTPTNNWDIRTLTDMM